MKGLKCVAIVGKQNEPLLVRCAEFGMDEEKRRDSIIEHSDAASGAYMDFQEEALKFHYFVHTALDIVDEKSSSYFAN